MTGSDLMLLLALAGAAMALIAVSVSARRARSERDEVRARLDQLTARLDARTTSSAAPHSMPERPEPPESPWVITTAGESSGLSGSDPTGDPHGAEQQPTRIEGRLFADVVLRESVVKAAALSHGVRRALRPETRNRIRFEMKQEVKRSRKQRAADQREARREFEAFQRRRAHEEGAA